MFDPTRLSVILFAVIGYGLPLVAVVLTISVTLRTKPKGKLDSVSKFRLLTALMLFVVWFGIFFYNETVYRPKTVLRPVNPALEERLKQVDTAPEPTPAPKPTPTPTFDEQAAKNRRDNEEARKAFDDVAPDRK